MRSRIDGWILRSCRESGETQRAWLVSELERGSPPTGLRLAPHVHIAMRGTVARAEIRRVLAATYHQVWWPGTSAVKYDGDQLPVWDEATRNYLDSATGEVLPSWDQALDAIGVDDQPHHVARFGSRFDAQGVLAGSRDAARCIGYLTKYLTKQVGACHRVENAVELAHAGQLVASRARRGQTPSGHPNRSQSFGNWEGGVMAKVAHSKTERSPTGAQGAELLTEQGIVAPDSDRLWTVEEVSHFLGIPVATLYRWHYLGAGPKPGRVGRHLRYLPADVISWFRKQQAA
jgi:predicted DNA-binding transcriptional regulator AlpA